MEHGCGLRFNADKTVHGYPSPWCFFKMKFFAWANEFSLVIRMVTYGSRPGTSTHSVHKHRLPPYWPLQGQLEWHRLCPARRCVG